MALIKSQNKNTKVVVGSGSAGRETKQSSGLSAQTNSASSAYNQYLIDQVKKTAAAAPPSASSAYNQYLIEQAKKVTPTAAAATASAGSRPGGGTAAPPVIQTPAPAPSAGTSNAYDLAAYLRQQREAGLKAELAALEGAYRQSMADYEAAAAQLPRAYDAARNAAAAQNALARQSFDERAAAAGLSSGAAAQTALARDSVYRGALANIDLEEAAARNENALAREKLKSQYETAIVKAKADGDASLANALYQELVRVQALSREEARYAQNLAVNKKLLAGAGLANLGSINSLADLAGLI